MPRTLTCIIALILAPCLLADPVSTAAASNSSFSAGAGGESITKEFSSQALASGIVGSDHSTLKSKTAAEVSREIAGGVNKELVPPASPVKGVSEKDENDVSEDFRYVPENARAALDRLVQLERLLDLTRPTPEAPIAFPGRPEYLVGELGRLAKAFDDLRAELGDAIRLNVKAAVDIERKRRLWSVKDVARRAALSPQTVHALGGKVPRRTTQEKLAAAFGMTSMSELAPQRSEDLARDQERNLARAYVRSQRLFLKGLSLALDSYGIPDQSFYQAHYPRPGGGVAGNAPGIDSSSVLWGPDAMMRAADTLRMLAEGRRLKPVFRSAVNEERIANDPVADRAVGRVLRRWRMERGWSSADLARHSHVARATISLVESGKSGYGAETFTPILKALGKEPEDLRQTIGPLNEEQTVRTRRYVGLQKQAWNRLESHVLRLGLMQAAARMKKSIPFLMSHREPTEGGGEPLWANCNPTTILEFVEAFGGDISDFWDPSDLVKIEFQGAAPGRPSTLPASSGAPQLSDVDLPPRARADYLPDACRDVARRFLQMDNLLRFHEPGLRALGIDPDVLLMQIAELTVELKRALDDAQARLNGEFIARVPAAIAASGKSANCVFTGAGLTQNVLTDVQSGRLTVSRQVVGRLARELGISMRDLTPERPDAASLDVVHNLEDVYRSSRRLFVEVLSVVRDAAGLCAAELPPELLVIRSVNARSSHWAPARLQVVAQALGAPLKAAGQLRPALRSVTEIAFRQAIDLGQTKAAQTLLDRLREMEMNAARRLKSVHQSSADPDDFPGRLRTSIRMRPSVLKTLENDQAGPPHRLWFQERRLLRLAGHLGMVVSDFWPMDDLLEIYWPGGTLATTETLNLRLVPASA